MERKPEQISRDIAAFERKLTEAGTNEVLKEALNKKLTKLRNELRGGQMSARQLASNLLGARKKVKEMLAKDFKELILRLSKKPEYYFLKKYSKSEIKDDMSRPAKPVGYRFVGRGNYDVPSKRQIKKGLADGTVYSERRPKRSDVSRAAQLAKGGFVGKLNAQRTRNWLDGKEDFLEVVYTNDGRRFFVYDKEEVKLLQNQHEDWRFAQPSMDNEPLLTNLFEEFKKSKKYKKNVSGWDLWANFMEWIGDENKLAKGGSVGDIKRSFIVKIDTYERYDESKKIKLRIQAKSIFDLFEKLNKKSSDISYYLSGFDENEDSEEKKAYKQMPEEELLEMFDSSNGDGGNYYTIIEIKNGKEIILAGGANEYDEEYGKGGEISVYNLRKGDKVKTRKGDIETIIKKTGSGSYETIENDYTHSPESLEFVSRPSRKMAKGGSVQGLDEIKLNQKSKSIIKTELSNMWGVSENDIRTYSDPYVSEITFMTRKGLPSKKITMDEVDFIEAIYNNKLSELLSSKMANGGSVDGGDNTNKELTKQEILSKYKGKYLDLLIGEDGKHEVIGISNTKKPRYFLAEEWYNDLYAKGGSIDEDVEEIFLTGNENWDEISSLFGIEDEEFNQKKLENGKQLLKISDDFGWDYLILLKNRKIAFPDRNSGVTYVTEKPIKNVDEFVTKFKNCFEDDEMAKGGNIDEMSDEEVEEKYNDIVSFQILAGDIDYDSREDEDFDELSIEEKRNFLKEFNEEKYENGGSFSSKIEERFNKVNEKREPGSQIVWVNDTSRNSIYSNPFYPCFKENIGKVSFAFTGTLSRKDFSLIVFNDYSKEKYPYNIIKQFTSKKKTKKDAVEDLKKQAEEWLSSKEMAKGGSVKGNAKKGYDIIAYADDIILRNTDLDSEVLEKLMREKNVTNADILASLSKDWEIGEFTREQLNIIQNLGLTSKTNTATKRTSIRTSSLKGDAEKAREILLLASDMLNAYSEIDVEELEDKMLEEGITNADVLASLEQDFDDQFRTSEIRVIKKLGQNPQPKQLNKPTTIIAGTNLEVMDFNKRKTFTFEEAKQQLAKLGNGWRLPTIEEAETILRENLKNLPIVTYKWYWVDDETNYTDKTATIVQFKFSEFDIDVETDELTNDWRILPVRNISDSKMAKGGSVKTPLKIKRRLEAIRKSIQNENVSYGELAELQSLSQYIDSNDIELRQAASIPEFEDEDEEYAKGGSIKKGNYSYIPQEEIDYLVTEYGKKIDGSKLLDGAYAKGNTKAPKMVRTQFEEEDYEYGDGGSIGKKPISIVFLEEKGYYDTVADSVTGEDKEDDIYGISDWLNDLDTNRELGSNLMSHSKSAYNYIMKNKTKMAKGGGVLSRYKIIFENDKGEKESMNTEAYSKSEAMKIGKFFEKQKDYQFYRGKFKAVEVIEIDEMAKGGEIKFPFEMNDPFIDEKIRKYMLSRFRFKKDLFSLNKINELVEKYQLQNIIDDYNERGNRYVCKVFMNVEKTVCIYYYEQASYTQYNKCEIRFKNKSEFDSFDEDKFEEGGNMFVSYAPDPKNWLNSEIIKKNKRFTFDVLFKDKKTGKETMQSFSVIAPNKKQAEENVLFDLKEDFPMAQLISCELKTEMENGGEISVWNLRKGDKIRTRKGDIETVVRKIESGYFTEENQYSHPFEGIEFVSRPGRKMENGGEINPTLSNLSDYKFALVSLGGSIGSKNSLPVYASGKMGDIIEISNNKEELKETAARMRKSLSPGERSYYGMSYTVIELTPYKIKEVKDLLDFRNRPKMAEGGKLKVGKDDFSFLLKLSDKELSKRLDLIRKQQVINGKQYLDAKKKSGNTTKIEESGKRLSNQENAIIQARMRVNKMAKGGSVGYYYEIVEENNKYVVEFYKPNGNYDWGKEGFLSKEEAEKYAKEQLPKYLNQ